MIPPTGKKRYHIKPSFFSFFGDLPTNNRGELTKNENLHQITSGIKITLEVVSLYSVVKIFKDKLYKKEWVVNIQPPFGKPEKVLEYLSRYVFRISITNRRIIEVKDGKILFSWKDYRTGLYRKMKLNVDEFIRRFLLHILPQGFFKVRYYGIFSSRYRKENINTAKRLLDEEREVDRQEAIGDGRQVWKKQSTVWNEIINMIQDFEKPNCPKCKRGRLMFAGIVHAREMVPG